ncbi:MAG TPA: hypothetical protein VNZ26_19250 [Vicinamibacterales bacterium]|nr:hypothetical protein [Vicinamibacterales bacterium]
MDTGITSAEPETNPAAVRAALERILSSDALVGADRRVRLLRFLVERTLAGDSAALKESVIAVEVFDRAPDYDPKVDSVVRVEMGRLRSRLVEYYSHAGTNDPVRIDIRKGSYQPVFVSREPRAAAVESAPSAPPVQSRFRIKGAVAVAAAALALVVLVLSGALSFRRGARAMNALPSSIAVLPFLNLSGTPDYEYLTDSISDELTEALAESTALRVVARTSAFQFKGKNVDVREIGRRLGAEALLEGSMSKKDERLRLVIQLIRVSDGYHLWSRTYDASMADLQSVEAEIAKTTVHALLPQADVSRRPSVLASTTDPEAHDLYLRAKYFLAVRTPDALQKSLMLARQAIERDPSYPLPYETVATAEWVLGTLTMQRQKEAAERALSALDKAIALAPNYGDAHALRGALIYVHDWDWDRAESEYRLAQDSGSPKVDSFYGWGLATRGRFDEADLHLRRAEELDPLATSPLQNRSAAFYMTRHYAEARRELQRWLELDPRSVYGLVISGTVNLLENKCDDAESAFRQIDTLYPNLLTLKANIAIADAHCGHQEDARRFLSQLAAVSGNGGPSVVKGMVNGGDPPGHAARQPHKGNEAKLTGEPQWYQLALVHAGLHDNDMAIQSLQNAVEDRESQVLWLGLDPDWDELRHDPRFARLTRQIGLPQ